MALLATTKYPTFHPGQIMDLLRAKFLELAVNEIEGGSTIVESSPIDGFRAIKLTETLPSGDTQEFYYMLRTMSEDATADASYFFNAPGWSNSWKAPGDIGDPAVITVSIDVYTSIIMAAWKAMIDNWSNPVDFTLTITPDEYVPLGQLNLTGNYEVETETGRYIGADYGVVVGKQVIDESGIPINTSVAAPRQAPFSVPGIGVDATAIQKIADALGELAFKDIDVSFNNGAFVFSVRGRVSASA